MANSDQKKAERFQRVVVPRVQKALRAIERIGRCGNRQSYRYTDEELVRIFDAINRAVREAGERFNPRTRPEPASFSLAPDPE